MKILGAAAGPQGFYPREMSDTDGVISPLFVSETNEKQGVRRASGEVDGQVLLGHPPGKTTPCY